MEQKIRFVLINSIIFICNQIIRLIFGIWFLIKGIYTIVLRHKPEPQKNTMLIMGRYPTHTHSKICRRTKPFVAQMVTKIKRRYYLKDCDLISYFCHILQLEEVVSTLFSNFWTVWEIIKIHNAKMVRISLGLTR